MGIRAKALVVTATQRRGMQVLEGVRDVATGRVYPFLDGMSVKVAADINAGLDTFAHYGQMFGQESYDIEAVES